MDVLCALVHPEEAQLEKSTKGRQVVCDGFPEAGADFLCARMSSRERCSSSV